ncbi:hypothetical protein WX98_18820 [Pseudomonas syringae pv. persicae]|nr:hypothetical protein WX98_18820 [Pseudomonas syringae pv. persicae]
MKVAYVVLLTWGGVEVFCASLINEEVWAFLICIIYISYVLGHLFMLQGYAWSSLSVRFHRKFLSAMQVLHYHAMSTTRSPQHSGTNLTVSISCRKQALLLLCLHCLVVTPSCLPAEPVTEHLFFLAAVSISMCRILNSYTRTFAVLSSLPFGKFKSLRINKVERVYHMHYFFVRQAGGNCQYRFATRTSHCSSMWTRLPINPNIIGGYEVWKFSHVLLP